MKRIWIVMVAFLLFCFPVYADIETEPADFETFMMNVPTGWTEENKDNALMLWREYTNPDTGEILSVLYVKEADTGLFSSDAMCENEFHDEIVDGDNGTKRMICHEKIGVSKNNLWDFCHAYRHVYEQRNGFILDDFHYYALVFHDLKQHLIAISMKYDVSNTKIEILEYAEQMHETIELK